jgi:hypothetical protein
LQNPQAASRAIKLVQRARSDSKSPLVRQFLHQRYGNYHFRIKVVHLRHSPAIVARLKAAETELAMLLANRTAKRPALLVPNVRKRYLEMVASVDEILAQDPERARENLRGILGDRIKLELDESGRFLWAEYSLRLSALVRNAEIMVAGARLWRCLLRLPRRRTW